MSRGPHEVTRDFEAALCEYTGARFAVTTNSCTSALLLACAWHLRPGQANLAGWQPPFEIPRRTYISVASSIIHAGGRVAFRDEAWRGAYQLRPYPVWDAARRFYAGMYGDLGEGRGHMACVSFHASKILADTQGGAVLHDDPAADAWLRRMRFDGRTEGFEPINDVIHEVGYHAYISADVAARLLWKLSVLSPDNADLPNSNYPDLSLCPAFSQ